MPRSKDPRPSPGRAERRHRMRRLRRTPAMIDLFAGPSVDPARLIYPVFVRPGAGAPEPIPAMPGVSRYGAERVGELARRLRAEGIRAVLLFGVPKRKDARGTEADAPRGAVPIALQEFRAAAPEIVRFTDVCLCAYTTHGHCGIVRGPAVDNDASVRRLAEIALAHAAAGADFVAPSAMMDHQVLALREALDLANYTETGILAYAAKFASTFYGPFREAEGSAAAFGDRRSYQMDPRNAREALAELGRDAAEGADVLMVKPALPYLDVIARARERFDHPLAAYQVSGEYAMIKAAADRGWLDEASAVRESLTAIRRAGADLIVTYFARDYARAVRERA